VVNEQSTSLFDDGNGSDSSFIEIIPIKVKKVNENYHTKKVQQ
jgi:hypothetical protein